MIGWLLVKYVKPHHRLWGAKVLLDLSLVLWVVSALTWASREQQTILGLSWLAITITCIDVLFTTDVRKEQDKS